MEDYLDQLYEHINNKNEEYEKMLDQHYMDKFNNVYQITEDDEIGIFLGVHDKINNNIIYMEN